MSHSNDNARGSSRCAFLQNAALVGGATALMTQSWRRFLAAMSHVLIFALFAAVIASACQQAKAADQVWTHQCEANGCFAVVQDPPFGLALYCGLPYEVWGLYLPEPFYTLTNARTVKFKFDTLPREETFGVLQTNNFFFAQDDSVFTGKVKRHRKISITLGTEKGDLDFVFSLKGSSKAIDLARQGCRERAK